MTSIFKKNANWFEKSCRTFDFLKRSSISNFLHRCSKKWKIRLIIFHQKIFLDEIYFNSVYLEFHHSRQFLFISMLNQWFYQQFNVLTSQDFILLGCHNFRRYDEVYSKNIFCLVSSNFFNALRSNIGRFYDFCPNVYEDSLVINKLHFFLREGILSILQPGIPLIKTSTG